MCAAIELTGNRGFRRVMVVATVHCCSVSVLKLLRDGSDVPVVTVLVVAFVVTSVHVFWQRVVNVGCVDSDVRRSRNFFISKPLFSSFSCALTSLEAAHEHARKKLRLKLSLRYAYSMGLTAEFEYDSQQTNRNRVTVSRLPHVSLGVVISDTCATQYGSQQKMYTVMTVSTSLVTLRCDRRLSFGRFVFLATRRNFLMTRQ